MSEENKHIINDNLLVSYLSKQTSSDENKLVEDWLKMSVTNKNHFEQIQTLWQHSAAIGEISKIDMQADWKKIQKGFKNANRTRKSFFNTSLYRIAAIIVVLLTVSYFANNYFNKDTKYISEFSGGDIKKINLPDGSLAVLNKHTEIKYSENFKKNRNIVLKGEAYFEVVHNKKSPFTVKCGKTITKVLGTTFNVATKGNKIEVAVFSGKVSFSETKANSNEVLLTKGMKGVYDSKESLLSAIKHDNQNIISWKTKSLIFKNMYLGDVVNDLKRYFEVEIEIDDNARHCSITTSYFEPTLNEILEELKMLTKVKVKHEKDKIVITGGHCNDK